MGASTVDSPLVYTTTSTPLRWSPWANSAINNSVPPYLFGGTAMNGGAIRATLIGFKLNNTSKMPNPTLVMRETGTVQRKLLLARTSLQTNFSACLDAA